MSAPIFIDEADLHALVDGELDAERRRKVEDHLLQHPEDAALVDGWRRQNAALRAAFEPVALETPPLSLREAASRPQTQAAGQGPIETGAVHWGRPGAPRGPRVRENAQTGRKRRALVSMLVTAVAGAVVAGAIFVVISNASRHVAPATFVAAPPGYAQRAGLTYATFATHWRPVEIDAAHRSELESWLGDRVGFSRTPDLTEAGFSLIGGRVAPGVAAPAGFLVYERADGSRLGLYFERAESASPSEGASAPANFVAIEWRANGYAFVLIGPLTQEAMQPAAERAAASVAAPLH